MQVEKEPLISIIIPIYNVEAYLTKCIASVVRQIYSNIEIILVDDGSPDNCGKICDAWAEKDSRIVVIHKKKWRSFRCTECWRCKGIRKVCNIC